MAPPAWLFDPIRLTDLDESSWLYHLINDVMSEDPCRNWFHVEFLDAAGKPIVDDKRSRDVQDYLEEIDAQAIIQTGLRHESAYGDGLVAVGLRGNTSYSKPIKDPAKQIQEIQYLDPKVRDGEFSEIVTDTDPNSETYGLPRAFKVKLGDKSQHQPLDATRAIHFQTRPRARDTMGLPMAVLQWSTLQLEQNVEWSVGQIAYRMATTVIQSAELAKDMEQRIAFWREMENTLNTLSVLVLDKDEELKMASNNPGNLKWLIDYMWDLIAAATRINRSRLLGAQSGRLASAESDDKRYWEWIRSRQETQLRKPLRQLVTLCLATDSLGTQAGGQKLQLSLRRRRKKRRVVSDMRFRLVFNAPESQTERERTEAEDKVAQTRLAKAQTIQAFASGLQTLYDIGLADQLLSLGSEGDGINLMAELFEGDA